MSSVSFLKDSYLKAIRDAKLNARGIDPKMVTNVESGVHVETMKLEAGSEKKDSGQDGNYHCVRYRLHPLLSFDTLWYSNYE